MAKHPLTERQREVYEWMLAFYRAHGYAPVIREIAKHFGVSNGSVFQHIQCLERYGYIKRPLHKHGGLQFVGWQVRVVRA